jgi:bacterioferritin-associated ferredoxin
MFNFTWRPRGRSTTRMYVCLCLGVSDRDVRRAVEGGACTAAEVSACTGAGTKCGSCRSTVAALVAAHGAPEPPPPSRRVLDVFQAHLLVPAG